MDVILQVGLNIPPLTEDRRMMAVGMKEEVGVSGL